MSDPYSSRDRDPRTRRDALAARLDSLADDTNWRSRRWHELSQALHQGAGNDSRWQVAANLLADMAVQEEELARRIAETAQRYREGASLVPPWSTPPQPPAAPASAPRPRSVGPAPAPTEARESGSPGESPIPLQWHPFPSE